MGNEPTTDVKIIDRYGKKLCAIHCPQGWNSYIPIPLPLVSLYSEKRWTNPQAIIRWSWHQVFESNTYSIEHNIANLNIDNPPTPCVVCGELAIKPVWVTGLFRSGITGVQCENKQCAMYHVTIPWKMFKYMKEIPPEYIPRGFYIKNSDSM
jgi:hypothetical protein